MKTGVTGPSALRPDRDILDPAPGLRAGPDHMEVRFFHETLAVKVVGIRGAGLVLDAEEITVRSVYHDMGEIPARPPTKPASTHCLATLYMMRSKMPSRDQR